MNNKLPSTRRARWVCLFIKSAESYGVLEGLTGLPNGWWGNSLNLFFLCGCFLGGGVAESGCRAQEMAGASGFSGGLVGVGPGEFRRMEETHFAPAKKPLNDACPVNSNQQKPTMAFHMVSKWCNNMAPSTVGAEPGSELGRIRSSGATRSSRIRSHPSVSIRCL